MKPHLLSIALLVSPAGAAGADAPQPNQAPERRGLLAPVEDFIGKAAEGKAEIEGRTGFRLRLSRSVENEARPATFSWVSTNDAPATYKIDGAVRLSYFGLPDLLDGRFALEPNTSFEAHLNGTRKQANSYQAALGALSEFHPDLRGVNFLLYANGAYEFNPSVDTAKAGGEALATLNWLLVGIGQEFPPLRIGSFDIVSLRWRPYLGFQGGGIVEDAGGTDEEGSQSYSRITGRLRADLPLYFLSPRLVLSIDEQIWYRLTTSDHFQDLFTASLNYFILRNVSFGLSYIEGERPPSFKLERTFALEVGLRF